MNTYDLLGTINKPTGVILTDSEGNEYPEQAPIAGYHVNMLDVKDAELVAPFVVVVNTPARMFAGRDDAVCLKFANRDEWLALGIEVVEDEII